jgi:hypothetical protein
MADIMAPKARKTPVDSMHVIEGKAKTRRRRISRIAPGVQDLLDADLEHRQDDEAVAKAYSVRRPDALFLFARRTRRMLRRIEDEIRVMRDELRGRKAA